MPKITEFPEDTSVGGAEKMYLVDGSTDKHAVLTALKSLYSSNIDRLVTLKAYEGLANNQCVSLIGGTSDNDELAGQFYWDSTSTATADDVDTVKVTDVTVGRWLRAHDQAYDVPSATDEVEGTVELATDAEAQAKSDATKVLVAANLAALTASETFVGMSELSTDAETITGTATDKVVTPANLHSAFSQSLGSDGYITLPGGLILAWGYEGNMSGNSNNLITVSSMSTLYAAYSSEVYNDLAAVVNTRVSAIVSSNTFTIQNADSNTKAAYWFAIGV
jgi:hypothetical protein